VRRASALALGLVALLAGCGGGGGGGARPDDLRFGRSVFVARCTGCHSLGRLGPRRSDGGDLADYRFTTAQALLRIRSMPPAPHMTERELRAVARFVTESERAATRARG
jgi:mono/diheme cytochrome c family protein